MQSERNCLIFVIIDCSIRQLLTDKTVIKSIKILECSGSNIVAISISLIELTIAISIKMKKKKIKHDSSSKEEEKKKER